MLTETEIIGKLREAAGGKQRDFADRTGNSPGFVSLVFSGKKPPSDKMLDLIGYRKVRVYTPK